MTESGTIILSHSQTHKSLVTENSESDISPCLKCNENCLTDSIFCDKCECWEHRKCAKIS